MIVGFSISFILLLLQYYSLTITTNVSSDDQRKLVDTVRGLNYTMIINTHIN